MKRKQSSPARQSASEQGFSRPGHAPAQPETSSIARRAERRNQERHQLLVVFRSPQGREDSDIFDVKLGPNGAGHIAIASAPGVSGVSPRGSLPYAQIFIEHVRIEESGHLSVAGWVVAFGQLVCLDVFINGKFVCQAKTGLRREDVGAAYAAYPNAVFSGFDMAFPMQRVVRKSVTFRLRAVFSAEPSQVARGGMKEEEGAVIASDQLASPPLAASGANEAKVDAIQGEEFQYKLETPPLSDGATFTPVSGRLTIGGWLLARSGIADFKVYLNNRLLGEASYGSVRQDVGAAFPYWPDSVRSGFTFHCPLSRLPDGEHEIRLAVHANNGAASEHAFRVQVRNEINHDEGVGIRSRVPRAEVDLMLSFLKGMRLRPRFGCILRLASKFDTDRLQMTLNALAQQAYDDWELIVLAADGSTAPSVERAMSDCGLPLGRVRIMSPSSGVPWKSQLAKVGKGRPMLHLLLLPGDQPGADAFLEFAVASVQHGDHDLFYADEIRLSPVTSEPEPFYKPGFSPDLLLSTNYIGRPWVATAALLAKTGITPASFMANGEYDLLLRCAEHSSGIHHLAKLLCQRLEQETDVPKLERKALEGALDRRRIKADVLATPIAGTWRIQRTILAKGRVSIIIPTCAAKGRIKTCIDTLRARTSYPDYEIICVDNIASSQRKWKGWLRKTADKVVEIVSAFNWSTFNNRASEVAIGEYLLFLNDDIEIVQDDWLEAMLEHAQRPEVGIVGPQLLYPDGTVQHAGMFLSDNGTGRHAFRGAAKDDPSYFGLALTQRNVIAVTGACLLIRRETFQRLGKFNEAYQVINNDLDLCLRAHRTGLLTVYTPYASLVHHERTSRAVMDEAFDRRKFDAAWKTTFAAGDPYFSPRLSLQADAYCPDDEPAQWLVPGGPLYPADEIHRVLVIKLDHVGDFVSALPSIRRLRRFFRNASITVLADPQLAGLISLEQSIHEFIPFKFFHSRSELGERKVTRGEFIELGSRLRPYRFDLAVDLRMQPSTREVLLHTGARFLAGFDHAGRFPYLDITLEWDGDRKLQRKRNHIAGKLVALVDAIGYAMEGDQALVEPQPAAMALSELPASARRLFIKRVVAIHPGAGSATKQWPVTHFSALIDLLIERQDVNVLLVGGPDDAEVADVLLGTLLHRRGATSIAGKMSLIDLPRLLKTCTLFIGNDSGPKHIAAAVGVPTIGIHSGVVDSVEWGPVGPTAIALQRDMTCSPCYLAKVEDCPRSLACLRLLHPATIYEMAVTMLNASRSAALS
jgi:ADP-heptose:LPS heptosyltransferase/GT2 family glycosyltransferase